MCIRDSYETGVSKAEWPARMQRLSSGALVGLAPANSEVWLDGGHNPHCGQAVATALGDLEERVSRQLVVIVGMPSNKDAGGFLANFAGMTRHIIAVPIPDHENAYAPSALAEAGRHLGMRIETAPNVAEALRAISRLVYEMPPRILITGSLYLAGAVLRENGTFPS